MEPVTQRQFFEAIQQIQDKIDSKHVSLRSYVGERSDKIENVLTTHSADDGRNFKSLSDRLLKMETQREEEAKQAIKHGTWAGILAAAALQTIITGAKVLFGVKP